MESSLGAEQAEEEAEAEAVDIFGTTGFPMTAPIVSSSVGFASSSVHGVVGRNGSQNSQQAVVKNDVVFHYPL